MRHNSKGSWSNGRIEELGSVTARCLDRDPQMADLANDMREAVRKMAAAAVGAKAAREEVRFFREQRNQAQDVVTTRVHDIEVDARKAAGHDKGAGGYRALFPLGLNGILNGPLAQRIRRTQAMVQTLAERPGMEAVAKDLADALAVFVAAEAAYQSARARAQSATRTADSARESLLANYRLTQATVFARLKDAKAAQAFFPDLRTAVISPAAEKPGGEGPFAPESPSPVQGVQSIAPSAPSTPPSPTAHADAA